MPKKPYQFKLDDETIADLEELAERIGAIYNGQPNRAAAIRYAVGFTKRHDPGNQRKEKSKKNS